jgi:AsmA protein
MFTDISGMKASGDLAADIRLTGRTKKLDAMKAKGSITLHKVGIMYDRVDAVLDGKITIDRNLMNIDIKSTIEKNSVTLKGSVRNYLGNPDIRLDLYSREFDIDKLAAAFGGTAGAAGKSTSTTAKASKKKPGPKDTRLTASGNIKVEKAFYSGVNVENLNLRYQFKDNKLKITDMTAIAGKGKVRLTGTVDLSQPGYAYDVSGKMNSLHAEELINILFPKAKDTLFGILSFNIKKLRGRGTTAADLKKHLFAEGDFSLRDGRITNSGIVDRLSEFIEIGDLKTIDIKEARGNFVVKNGVAMISSFLSSDDIEMDTHGSIGLDETLDIALDLRLSPRLTGKAMSSKIAQYIKNERGWGAIPLLVTGTLSKPRYAVDIEKAGKQVIRKEVDKLFDRLLEDKDEQQKQQLEPVRELLKGIFR